MRLLIVCVLIVLGLASAVLADNIKIPSVGELSISPILTKGQIVQRVKDGTMREWTVVDVNGRLFIHNAIANNVIEVLTSVEHKTPVVFSDCVDSSRCKSVGHSLYE